MREKKVLSAYRRESTTEPRGTTGALRALSSITATTPRQGAKTRLLRFATALRVTRGPGGGSALDALA